MVKEETMWTWIAAGIVVIASCLFQLYHEDSQLNQIRRLRKLEQKAEKHR